MAYSDYGGYAYKNGEHIPERSDAVLNDAWFTVPGVYPGFLSTLAWMDEGKTDEEIRKLRDERFDHPNGHVVLGDGDIYVGLYKQTMITVWYQGVEHKLNDFLTEEEKEKYTYTSTYTERPCIDPWNDLEYPPADCSSKTVVFNLPGESVLEVTKEYDDNLYQYVKLTLSDGTVWTGFSGYGVGAGLEDYGSTEKTEERLKQLYP